LIWLAIFSGKVDEAGARKIRFVISCLPFSCF
jgi:hypothetical protein